MLASFGKLLLRLLTPYSKCRYWPLASSALRLPPLLTESLFCSDISDCWLVAIPIHDFYSQLGLAAQCAGSSSPSGRKLLGLAGADTALKALFTERKLSEHKLDVAALKTLSKARNLQSGAISASGTTG